MSASASAGAGADDQMDGEAIFLAMFEHLFFLLPPQLIKQTMAETLEAVGDDDEAVFQALKKLQEEAERSSTRILRDSHPGAIAFSPDSSMLASVRGRIMQFASSRLTAAAGA